MHGVNFTEWPTHVSDEWIERLVDVLRARLARQFPKTDPDLIWDGIIQALVEYRAALPALRTAYDDSSSGAIQCESGLARAAWRNIANLVRSEKRRHAREARAAATWDSQPQNADWMKRNIVELLPLLADPRDRDFLSLCAAGERRLDPLIGALTLTDIEESDRRRAVKRARDRIIRYLQRHVASVSTPQRLRVSTTGKTGR
jgi:hypothetical protein